MPLNNNLLFKLSTFVYQNVGLFYYFLSTLKMCHFLKIENVICIVINNSVLYTF